MYKVHCVNAVTKEQKDYINSYLCRVQFDDINKCKDYVEKLRLNYPGFKFSMKFERKDIFHKDYVKGELKK